MIVQHRLISLYIVSLLVISATAAKAAPKASKKSTAKDKGPHNFFIEDPADGLCLGSTGVFQRCAVDTLWFVTEKKDGYQLHARPVEEDGVDTCLDRDVCGQESSGLKVVECGEACAKVWNILGDAESGYALVESETSGCMHRKDGAARMIPCSENVYTTLNLNFASAQHMAAMTSEGAKLVKAAAAGDKKAVEKLIKDGVDVNSAEWNSVTPLIAASAAGHTDLVKTLIKKGADVNAKDKDNLTALMEASIAGHHDVVKALFGAGADIEAQARSGITALWLAAGEGKDQAVKELISGGASPSNARSDGITALMAASTGGHLNVVKQLLSAGADADATDGAGSTALINAAEMGFLEVAELLLANGADVGHMSDDGYTPLIVACAGGHTKVASMLLSKGALVDAMHSEGVSPLMYAAAGGHLDTVKLLLSKGANVSLSHKLGGTALLEAAAQGSVPVLKVLLDAGADPLALDSEKVTPLMSSANAGHADAVKLFIEKKIDPNAMSRSGGTALMFACAAGHLNAVEVLLAAGVDVNAVVQASPDYLEHITKAFESGAEDVEPHKDGVSALMLAAQGGFTDIVKLLVKAGANVNLKDDENITALQEAFKAEHLETAAFLIESGASVTDPFIDDSGEQRDMLLETAVLGKEELALLLLSKGAKATHKDGTGATPLITAAHKNMTQLVEALVKVLSIPEINETTEDSVGALYTAANQGNLEVVKLLLDHGAQPDLADKDGSTPLMVAAGKGTNTDVVKLLIKAGADVNKENKDGHTPLISAHFGRAQIHALLELYGSYLGPEDVDVAKESIQAANDMIELLVKSGANVSHTDREGRTAADYDHKEGKKEEGGSIAEEL